MAVATQRLLQHKQPWLAVAILAAKQIKKPKTKKKLFKNSNSNESYKNPKHCITVLRMRNCQELNAAQSTTAHNNNSVHATNNKNHIKVDCTLIVARQGTGNADNVTSHHHHQRYGYLYPPSYSNAYVARTSFKNCICCNNSQSLYTMLLLLLLHWYLFGVFFFFLIFCVCEFWYLAYGRLLVNFSFLLLFCIVYIFFLIFCFRGSSKFTVWWKEKTFFFCLFEDVIILWVCFCCCWWCYFNLYFGASVDSDKQQQLWVAVSVFWTDATFDRRACKLQWLFNTVQWWREILKHTTAEV